MNQLITLAARTASYLSVPSQARAVTNARSAATSAAARRLERDEVALFLAEAARQPDVVAGVAR